MSNQSQNVTLNFVSNVAVMEDDAKKVVQIQTAVNIKLVQEGESASQKLMASTLRLADARAKTEQMRLIEAGKVNEAILAKLAYRFDREIALAQSAEEKKLLIEQKGIALRIAKQQMATEAAIAAANKRAEAERAAEERAEKERAKQESSSEKPPEQQRKAAEQEPAKEGSDNPKDIGESIKQAKEAGKEIAALIQDAWDLAAARSEGDSMKIAKSYDKVNSGFLKVAGSIPHFGKAVVETLNVVQPVMADFFGTISTQELEEFDRQLDEHAARLEAAAKRTIEWAKATEDAKSRIAHLDADSSETFEADKKKYKDAGRTDEQATVEATFDRTMRKANVKENDHMAGVKTYTDELRNKGGVNAGLADEIYKKEKAESDARRKAQLNEAEKTRTTGLHGIELKSYKADNEKANRESEDRERDLRRNNDTLGADKEVVARKQRNTEFSAKSSEGLGGFIAPTPATQALIKKSREEANDELNKLSKNAADKDAKTKQDHADRMANIETSMQQASLDASDEHFQAELNALKTKYDKEISLITDGEEKKKKIQEKTQAISIAISKRAAEETRNAKEMEQKAGDDRLGALPAFQAKRRIENEQNAALDEITTKKADLKKVKEDAEARAVKEGATDEEKAAARKDADKADEGLAALDRQKKTVQDNAKSALLGVDAQYAPTQALKIQAQLKQIEASREEALSKAPPSEHAEIKGEAKRAELALLQENRPKIQASFSDAASMYTQIASRTGSSSVNPLEGLTREQIAATKAAEASNNELLKKLVEKRDPSPLGR